MKELINILAPGIKPIEQWNDEDRKVLRLTLLAIGALVFGLMIPY